jgi:ketosteroid isomerase-like protein
MAGIGSQVGELVSDAKRRVGIEKPDAAQEGGRVGIVRGALQAFGSGDMDGFVDVFQDSATWEGPKGKSFPGDGEQEGPDKIKDGFVADAGRTYTSFGFRPESFIDADDADAVVVIGVFEGEGVEGGKVDEPGVQIWEFAGNSVSRVRIFTDSAGFPTVVTEKQEKEWEEEDRKKEEEEKKEQEEEKDGGPEAKSDSDSGDEGESDDKSEKSEKSDSGDDDKDDSE